MVHSVYFVYINSEVSNINISIAKDILGSES